jgi:hypothetical protein
MNRIITPQRLLLRLTVYFTVLVGGILLLVLYRPSAMDWLPIGGTDALEIAGLPATEDSADFSGTLGSGSGTVAEAEVTVAQRGLVVLFLAVSLLLTVVVMIPITWTYKATRHETGYRKTFVRGLIVLPLCGTTIVLLIQDSLALAFGLAALVAAVRFRVALQDPLDGIYIFASICVALAAGIGYLGVATVMAIFFCFISTLLWQIDYGRNPLDEARTAKDKAKLQYSDRQ